MTMRRQILGMGIAFLLCFPFSYADQGLVGTYKGSFTVKTMGGRGDATHPLILSITGAENGKLAGKLEQGGNCRGEYPIEGTYQGNRLEITTGEGAIRGCGKAKLVLNAETNKLVGRFGKLDVELSRSD